MAKSKWIRGSGKKHIWISKETHSQLKALKRRNESFDSVLQRLMKEEIKTLRGY